MGLRSAVAYSPDVRTDFIHRHRNSLRDYYQFGGMGAAILIASTPGLIIPWLPLQLPFALAGVVGLLFMILWPVIGLCIGLEFLLRAKDTPPGHCHNCGYDLRGAAHATCSECGTASGLPAAHI